MVDELVNDIDWIEKIYNLTDLEPPKSRKEIFNKIRNDDYDNDEDCFLALYDSNFTIVFFNLICDNDFLDLVEKDLMSKYLSPTVINHIVGILKTSIDFKTFNVKKYDGFKFLYEKIGREKIGEYDHKRAATLISNLSSKRTQTEVLKLVAFQNS